MRIQKVDNSTSFKAVNEKYIELAKKQISTTGKVLPDLFQSMSYDVYKHKTLHNKDAIDTVMAIKKIISVGPIGDAFLITLSKNKPEV